MVFYELSIYAKKGTFRINFSPSITFFYGKMGAGKSTIPRLIDFCLGNELVETPALQHEFLSAELHLQIGENDVLLEREKGSNQIIASYRKNKAEYFSILVPIQGTKGKSIIPDKHVENISDLIFYLAGFEPPYVRKSKLKEDTDLVRLSFRDLMWYCYLKQEEIDSSFFFLGKEENIFKQNKSRDVMRFILGYHREKVSQLENDLAQIRQRHASLSASAEHIRKILEESGIADTETINKQINSLETELIEVKGQLSQIYQGVNPNQHALDNLKDEARSFSHLIDDIKKAIDNCEFRIAQQQRLRNEFITSSVKLRRANAAHNVFKDVAFVSCPQCGQNIQQRSLEPTVCPLCMQILNLEISSPTARDIDLHARINELEDSIHHLTIEKNQLQAKLKVVESEKKLLDDKLMDAEKQYDSKYLSQAKELESRKGMIEGRIQSLRQLLPFPLKVKELEDESDQLVVEREKLQRELQKAREEAEQDNTNLANLESLFLDTLKQVKFPGVSEEDKAIIRSSDFTPHIKRTGDELFLVDFSNLGSGGKKTIFKACFALSIHRLATLMNISIPTFLIIDTPMKNISERENTEVFQAFYQFVYKLATTELKNRQLILIDKEFYPATTTLASSQLISRHMSPDEDPLIPYYRGH